MRKPSSGRGERKGVQVGKSVAAVSKYVDGTWCVVVATVGLDEVAWGGAIVLEVCHELCGGDGVVCHREG